MTAQLLTQPWVDEVNALLGEHDALTVPEFTVALGVTIRHKDGLETSGVISIENSRIRFGPSSSQNTAVDAEVVLPADVAADVIITGDEDVERLADVMAASKIEFSGNGPKAAVFLHRGVLRGASPALVAGVRAATA